MKTQEKIEQLAEEFLTFHQDGSKVYHIKIREAIEFAYTQCQKDNKDKKYTEEDLMSAFNAGINNVITRTSFDKWLNSLNKQDNESN